MRNTSRKSNVVITDTHQTKSSDQESGHRTIEAIGEEIRLIEEEINKLSPRVQGHEQAIKNALNSPRPSLTVETLNEINDDLVMITSLRLKEGNLLREKLSILSAGREEISPA